MDPIGYLTTPATDFTARAWVFFIAQLVLLGVGAYFSFVYTDTNSTRGAALKRLGYALLGLGVAGTLVGVLRLASVAPFTLPLWFYTLLVLEIGFGIFAYYYSRTTYRAQLAAAASTSKRPLKRVAVPQQRIAAQANTNGGTNGNITPVAVGEPRGPVVASGRRDSRRDRKRRKR